MCSRNNAFKYMYWKQDGPIFVFINKEFMKTTFYIYQHLPTSWGTANSSVFSWTSFQIFKMFLAVPVKIRTDLWIQWILIHSYIIILLPKQKNPSKVVEFNYVFLYVSKMGGCTQLWQLCRVCVLWWGRRLHTKWSFMVFGNI